MDNKTFNSLFHRLPFQQSRPANSQNHSLFLCVCVCCLQGSYMRGSKRATEKLTFASLQFINRGVTFPLQQRWVGQKKIYISGIQKYVYSLLKYVLLSPPCEIQDVFRPFKILQIKQTEKEKFPHSVVTSCNQFDHIMAIICDDGSQVDTDPSEGVSAH